MTKIRFFHRAPFYRCLAAASVLLLALAAGCGHDSDDDGDDVISEAHSSTRNSAIVGSWRLVSTDGSAWYAHFGTDGGWKITDDPEGKARRVFGTYTFDGSRYSGPMVNPGVGEGRIEGTVDGNSMTMDFIEYWHDPAKHVPYTGTKM